MHSLGRNPLRKPEETFCAIRNKCMKFYQDGPKMMELKGNIDFDVVKCVILIEEKNIDTEQS